MTKYRLTRGYDDGHRVHLKGDVIDFNKRPAPSSAVELTEVELASSAEVAREALGLAHVKEEIKAEVMRELAADAEKEVADIEKTAELGTEVPNANEAKGAVKSKSTPSPATQKAS